MGIDAFCSGLERRLSSAPGSLLETVAAAAAELFAVAPHEVGFFAFDPASQLLTFRWPPCSRCGASIPLTAVYCLAAETGRTRKSFLNNSFASTKHLAMFERYLTDPSERIPVQKIISVPVVAGSVLRGVIQVTRKGNTAGEAGADFGDGDVANLQRVAAVLAAHGM